ncbi:MAG: Snf7-domain-containing protein, partial [Olpidium bornovanus]
MNLFFGKAKAKTAPKDAIVKLRETLEMLEKRENFLHTKIENELRIAKANATKNKRAALMALKRKKAYEASIDKISGARITIETQVMAIENANVNLETMNSMDSPRRVRFAAFVINNILARMYHQGIYIKESEFLE